MKTKMSLSAEMDLTQDSVVQLTYGYWAEKGKPATP